jgi:hypothetical protein
MSQVITAPPAEVLEERLARGADWLFAMEQRGETGPEYARWLQIWMELLAQYEALEAE